VTIRLHAQRGFGLVELMIASILGLFLIGGALAIHANGTATYRVNEAIARVQETGDVALGIIVEDLRRAGYWSQTTETTAITGRSTDPLTPLPPANAPANNCYIGYYNNLDRTIESAGEGQVGGANPFRGCITDAMRQPGTDILVVRHAAATATAPGAIQNGRLYLVSNYMAGALFIGGTPMPAGFAATDPIHAIEAAAYYVNRASAAAPTEPSLRRVRLGPGPSLVDEELVSGIEDLQVQVGVDTNDDGAADEYVNAGSAAIDPRQVIATRVWVRARADRAELGFTDSGTYAYAGLSVRPNDGFRRLLLASTVQLRNARQVL
jgi:type IV pilus assembly protein PilW